MVERRDLPLFAWSEARQAARRRRQRLARHGLLIGLGCVSLLATNIAPPGPLLVWNASASAPLGLYRVAAGRMPARGDYVIARAPSWARALAARRHYLPADVPLVKRVAGVPGDRVCAIGAVILLDGRPVAVRRKADRHGRLLPWWRGCTTLEDQTVFLLMAARADSFDGRYFGPTPARDVIGRARPLWLR